ncbi:hypothetical protein N0V85_000660 [Neurospora sp. IMI 360204]|nr:hypothetical protein N0V85_000660 [Neurospora sp. IMI 360204]
MCSDERNSPSSLSVKAILESTERSSQLLATNNVYLGPLVHGRTHLHYLIILPCTFLETHVAELATANVAKSRIATGDIADWKDGGGLRRGLPVTGAVADIRVKAVDGPAEVARKKAKTDHRDLVN